MISSQDMCKLRVYVRSKKDELKKYGKVHQVVFHPKRAQAVGIMVKRPDLMLMKKRDDRFVPFDRLKEVQGGLEVLHDLPDAWDKSACKRLGFDLDECIIWDYMPVMTEGGSELGLIKDVLFDEETHRVDAIDISPGSVNKAVLGATRIVPDQILGYRDGAIVVADAAAHTREAGGLAAKAGEGWAKTKHAAGEKSKRAAHKAGELVDEGAYKTGAAIGAAKRKIAEVLPEEAKEKVASVTAEKPTADKAAQAFGRQLGRASHMFKDFKDEFDKASRE